jgi:hypothetical protein
MQPRESTPQALAAFRKGSETKGTAARAQTSDFAGEIEHHAPVHAKLA